jgi:DNA-binding transcriptional LysR family regulator
MDLELLQMFLVVAEKGSLLNAARALGRSRSTLRSRLRELEEQAGMALLSRTAEGLELTTAGRALLQRGRTLLQEASVLLGQLQEVEMLPASTLRVAVPLGLPPHVFCELAALARSSFPRWRSRVLYVEDPIAMLPGHADVAIHFSASTPPGPWISYQLWPLCGRLLASPEYLSQHGSPRRPEDLTEHRLLVWRSGDDPSELPLRAGGSVRVCPTMVSSHSHMLRCYAGAGLGIAWLPDGSLWDPENPALVPVLPDLVGARLGIRVAVSRTLAEVPRIGAAVQMAARFLRGEGARDRTSDR